MENMLPLKWLPVPGYEGIYQISETGLIKSVDRKVLHGERFINVKGKIISQRINNSGYKEVRLCHEGKTKTTFIHILKATAFIPNPENKKEVNHIDGNKLNNELTNLEWINHSENMKHAYSIGLCKKSKQVKKITDNCLQLTFPSIKKAAEFYSIPYSTCKNYLNGNRKNPTCLQYEFVTPAA